MDKNSLHTIQPWRNVLSDIVKDYTKRSGIGVSGLAAELGMRFEKKTRSHQWLNKCMTGKDPRHFPVEMLPILHEITKDDRVAQWVSLSCHGSHFPQTSARNILSNVREYMRETVDVLDAWEAGDADDQFTDEEIEILEKEILEMQSVASGLLAAARQKMAPLSLPAQRAKNLADAERL